MKELLRKKSVKISILIVTLLVVMGIVGINVRSAQRQREYDGHVEAAEKYLTELDYEQAIAEYMLALEIEPNNEEALNALEQIYQDYAQSLVDAGDYEKAVSILEEGYEQIGRESLPNKIEEFQVMQEEMLAKEAEIQEQKRLEEEQKRLEEEAAAAIPEISSLPIPEATVRIESRGVSDGGGSEKTIKTETTGLQVASVGSGGRANIWTQTYGSGSEMTGGHIGVDGVLQDTAAESTDAYGVTYRSYAFDDPAKNVQSAMDALADYMTANPDAGFTALVKKSGSEIVIVTYPALFPNGMEGLEKYPDIDLLAWACYIVDGKLYILCADETFDWLEGTPRPDLFISEYLTDAFNAISSILKQ